MNANFSGTLSPWTTISSISQSAWSPASGVQGASDGYVASFSETNRDVDTGYGEIYQEIFIPSVAGSSSYTVTVYIRFQISRFQARGGGSISITYGLFNPATNSWVCDQSNTYQGTTGWTSYSVSCSISVSGSYRLRAYITVTNTRTFTIYIDYLYISVYSSSSAVLNVYNRDSQPYYARLMLNSVTGLNPQNLFCEIGIGDSQPIQIRSGQIVAGETSEVVLSSGSFTPINVKCLTTSRGSYTLTLTLRYCTVPGGNGVCVYYPLTIVLSSG